MNSRRDLYYPAIGYTVLLALVWLLSWLADIIATFTGVDLGTSSLVSSEGVRWAMRNVMSSLNALPWGEVVLAVAALGLLQGCGIARPAGKVVKRCKATRNELRALLFSLIALLVYVAVLYMTTVSPWHLLLGVTGSFANSPFMEGLALLLFLGVLVVAVVYGFMYGNYRSAVDVASSVGAVFVTFVPALLALLPAAGVVASIGYIGVPALMGLSELESDVIAWVFYAIPFLHVGFKRLGLIV